MYFNSKDLSDPKNANLEISINETAFGSITCNALISNTSIQCGDLTASALYGGAVVQIQQNIDNAISAAALSAERPLSITNNLLSIDLSLMQTQIDDVYTKTEVDTLLTNPLATTYTTSLTFQDVAGTGVNTLQIKGGTSGIQVIDLNNNSLMDLDNTQISVNKPLVCSTTGNFTGNVTAPNLYSKTQVDTLIANIPLSSYYTQTQLDTMFSTVFNYCYSQSEADVLLNLKQDNLSNASPQVGMKT